ncbi:MAG: hypothetical protein AB7E52_07975 [Bdellovibrionales bacterium]
MKLGILGSGNTAAATALALAAANPFEEIVWVARTPDKATVALKDVASAYPDFMARVSVCASFDGHDLDVIAVLAGSQIPPSGKIRDGLKENVELVEAYVSGHLREKTVLVLLASPIDEVTEEVASRVGLAPGQVLGFGGDLDVRRLSLVMADVGLAVSPVHIVGEHGGRSVPVYASEAGYEEVSSKAHSMFKSATHLSGPPRNLATGVLMAELLRSLTSPVPRLHYVTTRNEKYGAFLTWPTVIARGGRAGLVDLDLGSGAQKALETLLAIKKEEGETRKALLA